jgi:hypothetical protein
MLEGVIYGILGIFGREGELGGWRTEEEIGA